MFTARYELIPYIKQITFRLQKVNCIWLMGSKIMRWVGQVASRGKKWVQRVVGWHEERSHLENLDIDVRVFLNWAIKKYDLMTWTGLIWLRAGTFGVPLWTRTWRFCLHKVHGISWITEGLLAFQGLCCMQSVSRAEIKQGNESLNYRLQPCAVTINSNIPYEYKIGR